MYNSHYDRQQRHLQIESAQLLQQCSDVIEGFNRIQETMIRMVLEAYQYEEGLRWQNRLDGLDSLLTNLDRAATIVPSDRLDPAIQTVREGLTGQFPDDAEMEAHIDSIFTLHKVFFKAEPDLLRQVIELQATFAKSLVLQEAVRRGAVCEDCKWSDYDIIRIVGMDTIPAGSPFKAKFRLVPVQRRDISRTQCKINGVEYPVDRDLQVSYSETPARPGRRRILVQMWRTNPLTGEVDQYLREFTYFSEKE